LAADGSIDQPGFAEVLEYLIDAKVHGIIVAATTGEYYIPLKSAMTWRSLPKM
jgi:4-hydroxy-tetrahydrodipicolinate synthase